MIQHVVDGFLRGVLAAEESVEKLKKQGDPGMR
jgi:hypothetical protein